VSSAARPTVLLLHGQPGGAADWNGVVAGLGERADVLAPDRPGWDGVTPPRDLAGNAAAALSALDERGTERAVIVGHSLGAAVAAWLAATRPDRASALVLAAPAANPAALYPVDRWLSAPVAGELAAATILGGLGLALGTAPVRRWIARTSRLDDGYLRGAGAAARRPASWRAYAAEQRALVRGLPELERRLGAISAPTTIIAGSHDRVVPARAVERLRDQIPGARLQHSTASGHLVPQRDPQTVVGAILAALGDGGTL
jgi:pimeloyl-ACP methyl ester carboxylesterase